MILDAIDNDTIKHYQVSHVEISKEAESYLCRQSTLQKEAYQNACDIRYDLPLYPTTIDVTSGKYRNEFIELSKIVISVRVNRVILKTSLDEVEAKINQLNTLKEQCYNKYCNIINRINQLEEEVYNLQSNNQQFFEDSNSNLLYNLLVTPSTRRQIITILTSKDVLKVPYNPNIFNQSTFLDFNSTYIVTPHTLDMSIKLIHHFETLLLLFNQSQASVHNTPRDDTEGDNNENDHIDSLFIPSPTFFVSLSAIVNDLLYSAPTDSPSSTTDLSLTDGTTADDPCQQLLSQLYTLQSFLDDSSSLQPQPDYTTLLHTLIHTTLTYLAVYTLNPLLRTNAQYIKTLELLRLDRIKRSGGRLAVVKGEVEVEYDQKGVEKWRYILTDEYIDTSIIHNTEQRLKYYTALPMVNNKLIEYNNKYTIILGEYICLIQYGYELVTPHIQRLVRGIADRRCIPYIKAEKIRKIQSIQHKSCIHIQCIWRRKHVYKLIPILRAARLYTHQNTIIIHIQRHIRGYIQRNKYKLILYTNYIHKVNTAATLIQAQYRGYIHRIQFTHTWEMHRQQQLYKIQTNSITIIQALFRGYFVRKYTLVSYRIRQRLSPEVLVCVIYFI